MNIKQKKPKKQEISEQDRLRPRDTGTIKPLDDSGSFDYDLLSNDEDHYENKKSRKKGMESTK